MKVKQSTRGEADNAIYIILSSLPRLTYTK